LLEPQTDVRNLCEPAVADKPLDCQGSAASATRFFSGATEHPALTTAQTRVSLVTIAPGGTLRPTARTHGTWVIALDSADVNRGLVIEGAAAWVGGTFRAPAASGWALRNRGRLSIRAAVVVKP
jgi:hypothetical protein